MEFNIRTTNDGSKTLFSETFQENYHSTSGAITESNHVFIDSGLRTVHKEKCAVFEMGFGTGLNALLTFLEAQKLGVSIEYTTVELYPLPEEILFALNLNFSGLTHSDIFHLLHQPLWNQRFEISPNFFLTKIRGNLLNAPFGKGYDLVYFDAFSPAIQPELWTEDVFAKLYNSMNPQGILNTYCAKGAVRRAMQHAGFIVERLAGPPPKREMIRATKK
jgi:tRNA U34 5-methylaminomethyl-2-thiouridine-forming methyltransferase MnmC